MYRTQSIIILLSFLAVFFLCISYSAVADNSIPQALNTDYGRIVGEWQRVDGNYLIRVSNVLPDGQATVEYFNPSPIHVAQAKISTQKGMIRLFVKFQDKFYEGSTYTLYYYAQKDSLVGFYYQAPMDRTYEVIFSRKI